MSELIFVPTVILVAFVVPLWLLLHYVSRWRAARSLSNEDERMLVELWQSARRMEARIASLETILDAQNAGWRRRP